MASVIAATALRPSQACLDRSQRGGAAATRSPQTARSRTRHGPPETRGPERPHRSRRTTARHRWWSARSLLFPMVARLHPRAQRSRGSACAARCCGLGAVPLEPSTTPRSSTAAEQLSLRQRRSPPVSAWEFVDPGWVVRAPPPPTAVTAWAAVEGECSRSPLGRALPTASFCSHLAPAATEQARLRQQRRAPLLLLLAGGPPAQARLRQRRHAPLLLQLAGGPPFLGPEAPAAALGAAAAPAQHAAGDLTCGDGWPPGSPAAG